MITKITGPMTSRKSFHLIADWLADTGSSVCIKPADFDRDGSWIASRACHVQVPCVMVDNVDELVLDVDTLYVDEAQGFTYGELLVLSRMADNVRFYGLDEWATREQTSIGEMKVDVAVGLVADCKCGGIATMTKWVSGDDPIFAVYEACCERCWDVKND